MKSPELRRALLRDRFARWAANLILNKIASRGYRDMLALAYMLGVKELDRKLIAAQTKEENEDHE